MDYHRWSSLYRPYDISLRHNQLILALSAACAAGAFWIEGGELGSRLTASVIASAVTFLAATLAKELDPDRPRASVLAALLVIPFLPAYTLDSALILFWLIGAVRFLNRATGLRPKFTDLVVLLLSTVWLGWQVTPIFGILMSIMLSLDSQLPDGQRIHAMYAVVVFFVTAIIFGQPDWTTAPPVMWQVAALMSIAFGFTPVVLSAYGTTAVGDATGEPLQPWRVQTGQVFALGVGLVIASWFGERGILVLIGLWAALLANSVFYLFAARRRRSAIPL